MDSLIHEIQQIDTWAESCFKRSDLHDSNTLMTLGVEIGNHLRKLSVATFYSLTEEEARTKTDTFELHDAVIVGHMVRIYKLYDQLVYFVAEDKGEIATIFSRLLFETYVTMKYLIIKGKPSIKNFIRISFKSTIKQYQYIKGHQAKRNLTPIESRILKKVENRLRIVGLTPTQLAKNTSWTLDGLSFKGIVDFISRHDVDHSEFWARSYDFLYGSMSTFVHGSWYDIQLNHLEYVDGRFAAKPTYDHVDPRYILPVSIIPVLACTDFLNWRKTDPDRFLIGVLKRLGELLMFLNQMDEINISKRGTA